jgi:hypothetical protein
MKKILCLLLTIFFVNSSYAESEMTLEKCSELSQMAGLIMKMRQDGSTMAEVYIQNAQVTDNNKIYLLNTLTKDAFTYSRRAGYTAQENIILDFQNNKFINCFDTIEPIE